MVNYYCSVLLMLCINEQPTIIFKGVQNYYFFFIYANNCVIFVNFVIIHNKNIDPVLFD